LERFSGSAKDLIDIGPLSSKRVVGILELELDRLGDPFRTFWQQPFDAGVGETADAAFRYCYGSN
jgi:hypothetical protein